MKEKIDFSELFKIPRKSALSFDSIQLFGVFTKLFVSQKLIDYFFLTKLSYSTYSKLSNKRLCSFCKKCYTSFALKKVMNKTYDFAKKNTELGQCFSTCS